MFDMSGAEICRKWRDSIENVLARVCTTGRVERLSKKGFNFNDIRVYANRRGEIKGESINRACLICVRLRNERNVC